LERLHFLPDQRRGGDQWLEAIYTHGVFYSRSGQVKSFFGPGASKLSRAKKLDAIIRASDDGGPYPTNQLAKLARIVQLAETGRIAVATAETLAGARRLMVPRDAAPPPLHLQQVLAVPFPGMATAQQVPIYSNLASFVQVQAPCSKMSSQSAARLANDRAILDILNATVNFRALNFGQRQQAMKHHLNFIGIPSAACRASDFMKRLSKRPHLYADLLQ